MVDTSVMHGVSFQGKQPEEQFRFYFRQHWIRLLWPLTKLCGWCVLIVGIGSITFVEIGIESPVERRILLLLLCGAFVVAQVEFLVRWYTYFLYVVVATDRKIHRIKKTLVSIDDHQSIDLWMLQDIHKTQRGIVQNVFRYGTVFLEAQETVLRIHFIPRVAKVYDKLMSLKEQARSSMNTSSIFSFARRVTVEE